MCTHTHTCIHTHTLTHEYTNAVIFILMKDKEKNDYVLESSFAEINKYIMGVE